MFMAQVLSADRSCQQAVDQVAVKEIWVYLLAYNRIRLMIAEAALIAHRLPRQISYTHTVQRWIAWDAQGNGIDHKDKLHGLFVLITKLRVGERPGRIEPRVVKRRSKSYLLLTKPRAQARAYVQKHDHPKKLK